MQNTTGHTDTQENSTANTISDGILVIQHLMVLAGFTYLQSQLVLVVVGLLGGTGSRKAVFDGKIADRADCEQRTIRRWRRAYLEQAEKLRFRPLLVELGELNHKTKQFTPTHYAFPAMPIVAQIVEAAQAKGMYQVDREATLIATLKDYYKRIPGVPPMRQRRSHPRPQQNSIEKDFERGLAILSQTNDRARRNNVLEPDLVESVAAQLEALAFELRDFQPSYRESVCKR